MRVVHQPTTVPDRRRATASAPAGQPTPARRESDQLDQLRFIHDVARLATTARTWDELLETVVDGTRDALHAETGEVRLPLAVIARAKLLLTDELIAHSQQKPGQLH